MLTLLSRQMSAWNARHVPAYSKTSLISVSRTNQWTVRLLYLLGINERPNQRQTCPVRQTPLYFFSRDLRFKHIQVWRCSVVTIKGKPQYFFPRNEKLKHKTKQIKAKIIVVLQKFVLWFKCKLYNKSYCRK